MTNQLVHFTKLNMTNTAYNISARTTQKTLSIVIVQQYIDRCIQTDVCLFAYCIATTVVYRVTA
jgi:hypothetical protein